MKFPGQCSLWCHGCKRVRPHRFLVCAVCGRHKHPAEVLVTYSDYDGAVSLPLHLLPISELSFRMRKVWLG